jgi:tetratricopeptide (TPR) repeat protein
LSKGRSLALEKKKRWLPWSSKKKDDQELEELRKRISERPEDARLHQRLAELLLERGKKAEAMEALVKAGECHAEAGFHLRAIAVYRRVLKLEESPQVMVKLAELYLCNGFLGDALAHYRKVIKHYRSRGKEAELLAILRRIPELVPEDKEVKLKYIELLSSEGYGEQALEELIRLYVEVREGPESPLVKTIEQRLRELGGKLQSEKEEQGKHREAESIKEKLHMLLDTQDAWKEPSPPPQPRPEDQREVLEEEDLIELEEDSVAEAREPTRGASPEEIAERLEEARVYEEHGLFEEAEEVYRDVLRLDPQCLEATQGLERIKVERAKLGRPEGSGGVAKLEEVERTQRALSEGKVQGEPSDPRSHLDMGIAYRELGLLDEAIEEFKLASSHPAVAFTCYREIAECFKRKGDPIEVIKWLRKAVSCKGVPRKAMLEAGYDLAQTLESQGFRKEALSLYRKIQQIDSGYRDITEKVRALADN